MSWIKTVFICALAAASSAEAAQGLTLKQRSGDRDVRVHLDARAPSFGPPPRGFIYGGPYPPAYPPLPPPAYGYPWGPAPYGGYGVPDGDRRQEAASLPGRVIILTHPVGAEVFVDGVRLRRRDDLSYLALLLEGEYEIEARSEGYENRVQDVKVLAGTGMFVTLRLDPR